MLVVRLLASVSCCCVLTIPSRTFFLHTHLQFQPIRSFYFHFSLSYNILVSPSFLWSVLHLSMLLKRNHQRISGEAWTLSCESRWYSCLWAQVALSGWLDWPVDGFSLTCRILVTENWGCLFSCNRPLVQHVLLPSFQKLIPHLYSSIPPTS